jgi:hypothetical protein
LFECDAAENCVPQIDIPVSGTGIDPTSPTIHLPADITTNATSTTGATVTYPSPVSATDPDDAVQSLQCTTTAPATTTLTGGTFPSGTSTITCVATDTHSNTTQASFHVTVLGPSSLLANLAARVQAIQPSSLETKLVKAESFLARNDVPDTCSMLSSFVAQVRDLTPKQLSAALAASLITDAQRVEALLGCK